MADSSPSQSLHCHRACLAKDRPNRTNRIKEAVSLVAATTLPNQQMANLEAYLASKRHNNRACLARLRVEAPALHRTSQHSPLNHRGCSGVAQQTTQRHRSPLLTYLAGQTRQMRRLEACLVETRQMRHQLETYSEGLHKRLPNHKEACLAGTQRHRQEAYSATKRLHKRLHKEACSEALKISPQAVYLDSQ